MLKSNERWLSLILLICLIGSFAANLGVGLFTDMPTLIDMDDEVVLPNLFAMVVLTAIISFLALPNLLSLSRRWPPLLQPPQFC